MVGTTKKHSNKAFTADSVTAVPDAVELVRQPERKYSNVVILYKCGCQSPFLEVAKPQLDKVTATLILCW